MLSRPCGLRELDGLHVIIVFGWFSWFFQCLHRKLVAQLYGDLHMLKPCCSFHGGLWIPGLPCIMFSQCALSENPKVLNIPVYQKKYSNLHRLDRFCLLRKGDACHVIMFFHCISWFSWICIASVCRTCLAVCICLSRFVHYKVVNWFFVCCWQFGSRMVNSCQHCMSHLATYQPYTSNMLDIHYQCATHSLAIYWPYVGHMLAFAILWLTFAASVFVFVSTIAIAIVSTMMQVE